MAFSSTANGVLSDRLYAKIESKYGKLPKPARAVLRKLTDALAEGIIEFLSEDVVVEVSTPTAGTGGVGTALSTGVLTQKK
jgi:stalled ribosome rescue protein Dom34